MNGVDVYAHESARLRFWVRFFLLVPFFFDRVTLIGSGVLVRGVSSGTSYGGKGDRRGGVERRLSDFGVDVDVRANTGGGDGVAPSGISPSLSITNGPEGWVISRSAGNRGSFVSVTGKFYHAA